MLFFTQLSLILIQFLFCLYILIFFFHTIHSMDDAFYCTFLTMSQTKSTFCSSLFRLEFLHYFYLFTNFYFLIVNWLLYFPSLSCYVLLENIWVIYSCSFFFFTTFILILLKSKSRILYMSVWLRIISVGLVIFGGERLF